MAQPENYPMSPISNGSNDDQPEAKQALPVVTSQPVGHPQGAYPGYSGGGFPQPPQYAPPAYQQSLPGQVQIVSGYPQPSFAQSPVIFAPPPALYPDPSLPPGLEYLNMVDQLLVKQNIVLQDLLVGTNKYVVANNLAQQMYEIVEEIGNPKECGPGGQFDMIVFDNHRTEIMRIHRPYRFAGCFCCCCCHQCPFCVQEIRITSRTGQILGSVKQNWTLIHPKFSVRNPAGETILHLLGTNLMGFDVLSMDKEHKIGKIDRKGSTNVDTFGVTFPKDLDVNAKATLLAATILIDYMFFDARPRTIN